jgi:hypothetical protein
MTEQEFQAWLFPPKLSTRRKWAIRAIMLAITILVAWAFNSPEAYL